MQFSKNTRSGSSKKFCNQISINFSYYYSPIIMLSKIDFPSPNKKIEKIIPNEKLKIVK